MIRSFSSASRVALCVACTIVGLSSGSRAVVGQSLKADSLAAYARTDNATLQSVARDATKQSGSRDAARLQSTGEHSATAGANAVGLNTIQLQVIHSSPDTAYSDVDLYSAETRLGNDLGRNGAEPFFTIVTGATLTVSAAPATSESVSEASAGQTFAVTDGAKYTAALVGVVNPPNGYNPDGLDASFRFVVNPLAETGFIKEDTLLINVLHAVPSATWLQVSEGRLPSSLSISDSLSFGSYSDYTEVPIHPSGLDLWINLSPRGYGLTCGGDIIEAYTGCFRAAYADILERGNVFTIVVPTVDVAPNVYDIFAVFPNGEVLTLRQYSSTDVAPTREGKRPGAVLVYPFPAHSRVIIEVESNQTADGVLEIFDMLGRRAQTMLLGVVAADSIQPFEIDVSELSGGLYFVRLTLDGLRRDIRTARFVIAR